MQRIDIPIGSQFTRWTVIKAVHGGWLCGCDCGAKKIVSGSNLRNGDSKSCGCFKSEVTAARNFRHGRSHLPEYNAWNSMKNRCYYERHKDYAIYGGRGIQVCDRWLKSFAAFYEDVGQRPSPNHTIDRIDSNGHYEPGNVRWADHFRQSGNRRNTIRVTLPDNRNVSLKEATRFYGANYDAVRYAVHELHEPPLAACERLGAGRKHKTGPKRAHV